MDIISSPRNHPSALKAWLKIALIGLFGLLGAAIPAVLAYLLWSWTMGQIAASTDIAAYLGLVKVGVTLLFIAIGGGVTIALAVVVGTVVLAFAAAVLEP